MMLINSYLQAVAGAPDTGQLLLSGDEQSGTDALKLSGDMTDGDDCELYEEI